jgi:hypothetical protein
VRSWFVGLFAVVAILGAVVAPRAAATTDTPIGRIGDTLRVEDGNAIADVTLISVLPSDIPPGFGYPPRWPRQEVWRAQIAVTAVQVPNPYTMAQKFSFHGVTLTGDSYNPRSNDAPDALQYTLLGARQGATVAGGVWWDVYRDLVSSVVLIDAKTGYHLAQWDL